MQVVKLAQPGYDARTAGDENLIFSSQWPLLKAYKQGSFTSSTITAAATVAEHDLGFVPMFWFFSNVNIAAWGGASAGPLVTEERSEFFGPTATATLSISDNKLVLSAAPGVFSGTTRLYYYIFALDITKQYNAPTIKVGAVSGARPKQVLKIAKPGRDATSDRLDDFVLHSRARSPLIHSVNPSGKVMTTFTVDHNLGYIPMFFGYVKNDDGSYRLIPTGQGGSSSFQSTEKTVTFNDTSGKEVSIVVLKDPFIVDYSVTVSV